MLVQVECEIDLDGASFSYDCTLSGAPVWGIIGSSGSGKTTLFNTIAGLITPSRGRIIMNNTVFFDHEKKINVPAHKRRIGYVFQENRLFPHLSVRENLLFGWRKDGHAPSPEEVSGLLEIDRLLDADVTRLSGGEQKRVTIARAILSAPHMLLLDEPFAGLDHRRSDIILDLLSRVRSELDVPLLITSHDSRKIGSLCDHFVLIDAGSVQNYGPCYRMNKGGRGRTMKGMG